jgi:adenylate kinase
VNIILFGPPGAGKGTQAQSIVKKHNYFQLSTGNLLRDEVKSKTDLGVDIEKLISNGKFVSDEIVNTLLRQSLTNLKYRDRIIFDGYPRNVEQAINLEVLLNEFNQTIGHTIFLNELHPCGVEHLKKRRDDNLEIVISRYDTYMSSTKPVLDFYSKNSNFTEIDGAGEIDQITNKINEILKV